MRDSTDDELIDGCIRLPEGARNRLMQLIELLPRLPAETRCAAVVLIDEIVRSTPCAMDDCLAEIDEAIAYLRERRTH